MEESKFTGGLLDLIVTNIVAGLITILTFGIALPWAVCYKQKWYANHTFIKGHQLVFTGNGADLFVEYIKWLLLTIITLGIYGFWVNLKLHAWIVSKTTFVK